MNAFGQSFDTAVNAFGVDFNAFNSAFGLNGFNPSAPTDPLLANYDFNFYTENDATIPNQAASGIGAATINEPASNTFDDTDPANKFLTIFAPDDFPNPTGGLLTPSILGAKCIEVWVNYPVGESYGQYFFDFRNGLSNGFWITADGGFGDNIGAGVQGSDVYANTTFLQAATADQPGMATFLVGKGWYQIVINFQTTFTDDMSFFMNSGGNQGMPIAVGQICIYDRNLTQGEITTIFNNKCGRYGLSPV